MSHSVSLAMEIQIKEFQGLKIVTVSNHQTNICLVIDSKMYWVPIPIEPFNTIGIEATMGGEIEATHLPNTSYV